jgi:hypothetical protein
MDSVGDYGMLNILSSYTATIRQKPILEDTIMCSICLNQQINENVCELNCAHTFCCECIKTLCKNEMNQHCPLCRSEIDIIYVQNDDVIKYMFY